MEIRQLLYFIEICQRNSFSKAAERLHISQQGISMAISRLESELSCKLFLRVGKTLQLTEQGTFLLEHAEEIVRRIHICEDYFGHNQTVKHLRKTIRISSAYGAIPEFAGELIFQFRQTHPDIWLGVQEYSDWDCEESVWNETAELGFSMAPLDNKRFESTPLFSRRLCLIVHKTHPLAVMKSVPLDVLRTTPIMMMDYRSKTNLLVTECCRQLGFQPEVQFTAGEIIAVHRLVNADRGVGVTVESVARDLDQPNICIIPFEDPRMMWVAHLIKKRGITLSPAAKTFERFVVKHMCAPSEPARENAPDT